MRARLTLLASVVSFALLAGCSAFGDRSGTEEPSYRVMARLGEVEIRHYDARVAAETRMAGGDSDAARNEGFNRLAGYIFGGNKAKRQIAMTAPVATSAAPQGKDAQQIAMTAPVAVERDEAGWRMAFYLPRSLTLESAPEPNDSRVRIVTVPPEDYAVLRFTGDRSAGAMAGQAGKLLAVLKDSRFSASGETLAWLYDPPWTLPFLRRNEVAVRVVPK